MNIIYEYADVLSDCKLFQGFSREQITDVLTSLNTAIRKYANNEIIINQDESIKKIGVVLEGRVTAQRFSASGDISVIATHRKASVFGEILACSDMQTSPVSVSAEENSIILFIEYSSVFDESVMSLNCFSLFVKNMMSIMSVQYFNLEKKIRYMSIKSIRERIMEFLRDFKMSSKGSYVFYIPFDRDEMAHYLNINRSALSRELSRMKSENIIDFNKNQFRIM